MKLFTKFFTALAVCALMLSACNKEEVVEFTTDDAGLTRANDKVIVFHKVVQGESDTPAEEGQFTFDLWSVKGNKKLGTYSTNAAGDVRVPFSDLQGKGDYFFREVFEDPDEAEKWETLEDLYLSVDPSKNGGANWDEFGSFAFGEGPTVVNIPVVPEEPTELKKVAKVNLTNDASDVNSVKKQNGKDDHPVFCYAVLDREILEAGGQIVLDMVEEDANHADKGEAVVTLVDGNLVITVDGELRGIEWMIYKGKWNNNGNALSSGPLAFPEGEDDVNIYVRAEYWK